MQSRSIPAPTKDEKRRMSAILEIGCVCCIMDGHESIYPVEVHHLLDGGVRIGHSATIAVCSWHHRGVPPSGFNQNGATRLIGPSLALDGKLFKAAYGRDGALLAFQNWLLEESDRGGKWKAPQKRG